MNPPGHLSPERLMQFAWGYAPTLIIEAAVRHHIFDLLDQSPLTVDELTAKTGASKRGLTALLNALVGLQFLSREGNRYALSPESAAFLVSGKPAYHGGFFHHISTQLMPAWLHLTEVVQTGRPATAVNQENGGSEFFADFVESLMPLSYAAAQALGQHLGLPAASSPVSVLDIGAGSGVWGIGLAHLSTQVKIRAVDWPRVLSVTERIAAKHGVKDRLATAPGDLLEADFGTGHQVATIGHILHSEGMERSKKLLKRTFDALASGGTIAIMEFVANEERTGPPVSMLFAVNMLVNTDNGDTFTFGEMSQWLEEAGFVNPRQLDVPAVSPLILATKP